MDIEMKEDRRVRKTKKALREGLASLLNEKSIQNITVKELTDKVDIHRSTFYANFKDIYELFSHMEDTIIQEINDIVLADYIFKSREFFERLIDYINSNRQVSRLFFAGNTSTAFVKRLTDLFKDMCIDHWRKEHNITGVSEELEYYSQFGFSGALGVIGLWVTGGFKYPAAQLVMMLTDIDYNLGKFFEIKFA